MKKLINISILLLTALLFFAGCGQTTGPTNVTGSADTSQLFDESEAPITIDSLALSDISDGTWEYKLVYVHTYSTPYNQSITLPNGSSIGCDVNSWTWVHSFTFTKSGTTLTVTSGTDTEVYTMDDANKAMLNSYAATHGESLTWNGNTLTLTGNVGTAYMVTAMCNASQQSYNTTRKNTAGTRFIVKANSSTDSEPSIQYLKKLD